MGSNPLPGDPATLQKWAGEATDIANQITPVATSIGQASPGTAHTDPASAWHGQAVKIGAVNGHWYGTASQAYDEDLQYLIATLQNIVKALQSLSSSLDSIAKAINQSRSFWNTIFGKILAVFIGIVVAVVGVAVTVVCPELAELIPVAEEGIAGAEGVGEGIGDGIGDGIGTGVGDGIGDGLDGLGDFWGMVEGGGEGGADDGLDGLADFWKMVEGAEGQEANSVLKYLANWLQNGLINGADATINDAITKWEQNGSPFEGWTDMDILTVLAGMATGPVGDLTSAGINRLMDLASSQIKSLWSAAIKVLPQSTVNKIGEAGMSALNKAISGEYLALLTTGIKTGSITWTDGVMSIGTGVLTAGAEKAFQNQLFNILNKVPGLTEAQANSMAQQIVDTVTGKITGGLGGNLPPFAPPAAPTPTPTPPSILPKNIVPAS